MYNTDICCNYNTPEVFLEEENDTLSDNDKIFIRNAIYRQELLNIFNLEEYNESNLNNALINLYSKINDCVELKECINKLSLYIHSNDELIGLMMLFSYDLMHITHKCICEYLETGKILPESINELKSAI
jgi:hypothetical protein